MAEQIPGYKITRKINQGGMATVYLALQLSVGREVALKIMAPALNADPVFSERFQREANIVGQLSHRHIVSIYDIGRHKSLNYIAMDYLPCGSLHDRMKRGIDVKEALHVIQQMSEALDHAHDRGYVHRDIKPDNILFREDGSAVLTDFGVAKTLEAASQMTMAGTVVGTPHYMSPEQARGKPLDGRADLYSLGIVLFEMLTGSVPYTAEEPVAVAVKHLTSPIPKLPPHLSYLQPLLNKLLAKDPDDRFQRGNDIASSIASLLDPSATSSQLAHLNKTTDPTAVQIISLLKALSEVTLNALVMKARGALYWLGSWRYNKNRGLHRRPRTVATQFSATLADSPTLANLPAATGLSIAVRRTLKVTFAGLLLMAGWVGFALWPSASSQTDTTITPSFLRSAADQTRDWLMGDDDDVSEAPVVTIDKQSIVQDQSGDSQPLPGDETAMIESVGPEEEDLPPPTASDAEDATPVSVIEPPPPPRNEFRVETSPVGARIRILNIKERYFPGIELIPGSYHIEVTKAGYDPRYQWIEMPDQNFTLDVTLSKTPIAGQTFHHNLSEGGKGPAMVILPAGKFVMGDTANADSAPTRQVTLAAPFAVSQYEITFADYKKYALSTGQQMPDDNRWGEGSRPVVNVSWQQAKSYTQWLSKQTGHRYRLLSEAEWEYAARAKTTGDFYWTGKSTSEKPLANCRRGCYSPYTSLLKSKTAPVGSFPANDFRLYDLSGNVAEWVEDCYQPHYLGAPVNGGSISRESCPTRVVRGGSLKDSIANLAVHKRAAESPQTLSDYIGFRVAVEL